MFLAARRRNKVTQLRAARQGRITPQMEEVARAERIPAEEIRAGVARGEIAIPANKNHPGLQPLGIGQGLRTKVNANIGTSPDEPSAELNLEKAQAALAAGADTLMDLSIAGDIRAMRRRILAEFPAPLGTVPVYQVAAEMAERGEPFPQATVEALLEVIREQAEEGVDFMTIHAGVTMEALARLQREGRIMDIVSRGGSLLANWMAHNRKENPFYQHFEELLEICAVYDVTLSLGDGLRPGCLADASDRAQFQELIILGELTERAWAAGVQVMIEGPGHLPMNQVEANVLMEKELCHGAPFYVLGPLVTDVAPGYDHITAAIGGAIAAVCGADFLCYVTPAEHLALPSISDVREGVFAARIAAHAADLVKGVPGAADWDRQMAATRHNQDWPGQLSLAIDPLKAAQYRCASTPKDETVCTMCGQFCALRTSKEALAALRAPAKHTA